MNSACTAANWIVGPRDAARVAGCVGTRRSFSPPGGTAMIKTAPALSISPEKVCYVAIKAREYDVKDAPTIPDEGSNPIDDAMVCVREDRRGDPVAQELRGFIGAMSEDEQVDLVALAWLGRGDGTVDDWDELRAEAARAHNNRTASYLMGMPLLADHLEEGLSQLGRSCEEFEMGL